MVETFFSWFKRVYGEAVLVREFERMVKEIEQKVWIYNLMVGKNSFLWWIKCRGTLGYGWKGQN